MNNIVLIKKYFPNPLQSGAIYSDAVISFIEDSLHNLWIETVGATATEQTRQVSKEEDSNPTNSYQPTITVSTNRTSKGVEIKIEDIGIAISERSGNITAFFYYQTDRRRKRVGVVHGL